MSKKQRDGIFSGIDTKKVLITTLISICILLPSIFAIFSIFHTDYKNKYFSSDDITVVLCDMNGNELFREDNSTEYQTDASLVSIFRSIQNNLERSAPISSDVMTEQPLIAKITVNGVTSELVCHFSFTQGASYCIDASGQYYKIPSTYSEYFLSSSFAELLYTEAAAPALTTADGQSITPKTATWKYRAVDNSTKESTLIKTTDRVLTYNTTGSIALSFATEPDYCNVRLFEDGNMIFEGSLEALSHLTLNSSTELNVGLYARWDEQVGRRFNGSLDFNFNVVIQNRADFTLSDDKLSIGDVAFLTATNIADPERLMFVFHDSNFTPTMYYLGDTAYAAIPYPLFYEGETYSFTVSYGISSRYFEIKLDTAKAPMVGLVDSTLARLGLDSSLFDTIGTDKLFLSGSSQLPEDSGFVKGLGFADNAFIDVDSIFSVFNEYVCESGSGMNVTACYAGRVVYVGKNDVIGRYVAVDSGLGVKLWYCNLSTTDVHVGDYVAIGDVIGKSGKLVTEAGDGFLLIASCGDGLIDVDLLNKALKENFS